jgi:hypothetical protein
VKHAFLYRNFRPALQLSLVSLAVLLALANPADIASTNRACSVSASDLVIGVTAEHGGGLNGCGCHFNRKTGECHCHQPRGCGCACQPSTCR